MNKVITVFEITCQVADLPVSRGVTTCLRTADENRPLLGLANIPATKEFVELINKIALGNV